MSSLKMETKLLIGALIQILVCAVLPLRWAVVPAAAMLLNSIITTIIQLLVPSKNTFQDGVVHGRSSAQFPTSDGTYGPTPANKSLVVFNLGVQFNHPLGIFAPDVKPITKFITAMLADIRSRRDELGLISVSDWKAMDRNSNATLNFSFYFRDVESVHKFAHEELHKEAWKFYETAKPYHIGVFHETFCVPAGQYETIYDHCRPVFLGKGLVSKESKEEGIDGRSRLLVSADTPALKSQYARLNRYENGSPKN
jgi:hypothetical protein